MKRVTPCAVGIGAVLNRVQQMLDSAQIESALKMLSGSKQHSPAIENAKGVCLLRLGRPEAARKVFRDLAFPSGTFSTPDDTPTIFRVNYVTALLLLDKMDVGIQLLEEIPEKQHPLVQQLKDAVRQWEESLPWWRRILLLIGVYPSNLFHLDFAPGALGVPESLGGPKPVERTT